MIQTIDQLKDTLEFEEQARYFIRFMESFGFKKSNNFNVWKYSDNEFSVNYYGTSKVLRVLNKISKKLRIVFAKTPEEIKEVLILTKFLKEIKDSCIFWENGLFQDDNGNWVFNGKKTFKLIKKNSLYFGNGWQVWGNYDLYRIGGLIYDKQFYKVLKDFKNDNK